MASCDNSRGRGQGRRRERGQRGQGGVLLCVGIKRQQIEPLPPKTACLNICVALLSGRTADPASDATPGDCACCDCRVSCRVRCGHVKGGCARRGPA